VLGSGGVGHEAHCNFCCWWVIRVFTTCSCLPCAMRCVFDIDAIGQDSPLAFLEEPHSEYLGFVCCNDSDNRAECVSCVRNRGKAPRRVSCPPARGEP
jgi:hypothetical protein